ncbi:hypothetical protein [uncultured Campylobacter sp.]|nr:hypothetical protein [uncultured Campylobacter sp.]
MSDFGGTCRQNLDSQARCPTKFYAISREPCIRREFDEILKARFKVKF